MRYLRLAYQAVRDWYFFWLVLRAWLRGLRYTWPSQAPVPPGYHGCSCGFRHLADAWGMYAFKWLPWCFQRTRGLGTARLFIIPLTEEEKEWQAHMLRCEQVAWKRTQQLLLDEHNRRNGKGVRDAETGV